MPGRATTCCTVVVLPQPSIKPVSCPPYLMAILTCVFLLTQKGDYSYLRKLNSYGRMKLTLLASCRLTTSHQMLACLLKHTNNKNKLRRWSQGAKANAPPGPSIPININSSVPAAAQAVHSTALKLLVEIPQCSLKPSWPSLGLQRESYKSDATSS